MNKKILIVGSGITGATLAFLHKQKGDNVIVYEKRSHIGGNIYTERENCIDIHKYGAHIFHTNHSDVWTFINQFAKFNNYVHIGKTKLDNKLYSLPINMNTINEVFNIYNPNEVTDKHISKLRDLFFKGYTAKQWGVNYEDVPKEVINRLPIRYTFDNRYFDDHFQGIPINGYTSIIYQMLCNIPVILDYNFTKEDISNKYDIIYHTGMIDEFMEYELGALEYRSLKFETTKLNINNYQGAAVINEASINVPYTRTIEHKHFNKSNSDVTYITKEYPIKWNPGKEAYYTVNNKVNNDLYKKYTELVNKKYNNIIFCGRLGSYRYLNMDEAIKECFTLTKNMFVCKQFFKHY